MQPLIDLKKIELKKVIKWLKRFFDFITTYVYFALKTRTVLNRFQFRCSNFFSIEAIRNFQMSLPVILVLVQTYFLQIVKPFVNVGDKSKIQIIIESSNRSKIVFNMLPMYVISGRRHCKFDKSITQTNFLNNNLNVFSKIICTR